jgi:hypothetical protein
MKLRLAVLCVVGLAALAAALAAETAPAPAAATGQVRSEWQSGRWSDPKFFPLAVWLQSPRRAAEFKALGINLYIGSHQGPTEADLALLAKAGMPLVCDQNALALKHRDDPLIVGWMHGDEPDNAQEIANWKSAEEIQRAWPEAPAKTLKEWGVYGPPIPPTTIIAEYQQMRKADPTRPVLLNLGQAVAWDAYYGRGYRSRHPEDYPEYCKGGDIVSFDIYPVVHDKPEIKGKLEMVPLGVERLRKWAGQRKTVWNCIECTDMGGAGQKPTPSQVKTEIWMSLIHGSRGIIYFVHIFKPDFIEAGLLADPEMAEAVGRINRQITELAPLLNSPTVADGATVESSNKDVPLDLLVKKQGPVTYIFAVAMRDAAAKGTFQVKGLAGQATAEVLGEERRIDVTGGKFADEFKGYGVHLYRITK